MWDSAWQTVTQWGGWHGVGTGVAWVITSCLLIAGLVGCIIPILPGHLILLFAAIAHRLMLGREQSGMEWWTFVILTVLLTASQIFEFAAGAAGTKWFGGTKWGAWGALLGGIVGMFFFPVGLIAGPLIGAFGFEKLFAKQELRPAAVSGVGSVVGTVAGMGMKLAIGIVMIVWFFVDCFWVG
jgi:uncharacterized protein YqgC (DUF456 family)